MLTHSNTIFKSSNLKILTIVRRFKSRVIKDFPSAKNEPSSKNSSHQPKPTGSDIKALSLDIQDDGVDCSNFVFFPEGSQQENFWVSYRLKMLSFKVNAALTLGSSINNRNLTNDRWGFLRLGHIFPILIKYMWQVKGTNETIPRWNSLLWARKGWESFLYEDSLRNCG